MLLPLHQRNRLVGADTHTHPALDTAALQHVENVALIVVVVPPLEAVVGTSCDTVPAAFTNICINKRAFVRVGKQAAV